MPLGVALITMDRVSPVRVLDTAKDIAKLPISPICDRRHFRENDRMVATTTVHETLKLIL